jgi:hypothetical protein
VIHNYIDFFSGRTFQGVIKHFLGRLNTSQYVPPVEFFVDHIGHPRVVIVMGSEAAEMDEDPAAMLAAKVGKMASRDAEPILIMTDIDFDFAGWKSGCEHNLILTGGPVVNSIVDFLIHEGLSHGAWETSRGEGDYLVGPLAQAVIF